MRGLRKINLVIGKMSSFQRFFSPDTKILNPKGDLMSVDVALEGVDVLAFYFSAHWCPPCRKFTPKFAEYYKKLKINNPRFEVIFISCDQSENEFKEYYQQMPWLALPFDCKDRDKLCRKYATYIPTCIFFDRECNILTKDGVAAIASDANAVAFPYKGYKAPASLLQNPTFIMIVIFLIFYLIKRFG